MPSFVGFVWIFIVCQRTCLPVSRIKNMYRLISIGAFRSKSLSAITTKIVCFFHLLKLFKDRTLWTQINCSCSLFWAISFCIYTYIVSIIIVLTLWNGETGLVASTPWLKFGEIGHVIQISRVPRRL